MDRRAFVAVAVVSAVLGVAAMAWLAPDRSGPDPLPAPAPVAPVVAARPSQGTAVAARTPGPHAPTFERPPVMPLTIVHDSGEKPAQPPPLQELRSPAAHDLDQLYEPDAQGLTSATFARKERFVACWRDHGGAELQGRFTLKVTVADGGDEVGKIDAEIVNADASQAMADCVMDAIQDAAFPTPGDMAVSMIVPIPIPGN